MNEIDEDLRLKLYEAEHDVVYPRDDPEYPVLSLIKLLEIFEDLPEDRLRPVLVRYLDGLRSQVLAELHENEYDEQVFEAEEHEGSWH